MYMYYRLETWRLFFGNNIKILILCFKRVVSPVMILCVKLGCAGVSVCTQCPAGTYSSVSGENACPTAIFNFLMYPCPMLL